MAKPIIELIKVLRDRTGAGMMDCKHALEESDLDVEKAIDWLRAKGISKAQAKSSRIAAEGSTGVITKGDLAIVGEINCETDFVAKGEKFHKLVDDTLSTTLEGKYSSIEEAREATKQLFVDATVSMGEKLDYRRFEIVEKSADQSFGSYVHMEGKIVTLVVLDKVDDELAQNLAIHIAANNPVYVTKEDIPAEIVEKETAIALEAAKTDEKIKDKPEAIVKNIVAGKVSKMFAESTLVSQPYLFDGEKTVGQVLKEAGANIVRFIRYAVGEGIEKRHDDFVSEVMKEMK